MPFEVDCLAGRRSDVGEEALQEPQEERSHRASQVVAEPPMQGVNQEASPWAQVGPKMHPWAAV